VIVRLLNLLVISALIFAAAYVYRIKFDSTVQAERLAKLRTEVRRERDKIASLRAQWSELDNPARIEQLAKHFLKLKSVAATQFDTLDHLPDQPPDYMRPGAKDPIGGMIENLEEPVAVTGSIGAPGPAGNPAATAPNAASSNTGAPAQ
jgi:hypothetical protein